MIKRILGSPTQGDTVSNFTEHIRDHWAVRGCGDLPPWGGVYILKREWLEYEENNNKVRTITPVGDVSGGLNLPVSMPHNHQRFYNQCVKKHTTSCVW